MEATPLISVIVPIYNVASYVRKCLDSLKKQTLREIEIICIDDGSTDGSGRVADEYVSEEFPIFRVIHTENRGLSAARNRGIDEARADWIMFVDSDDWVGDEFCRIPHEAAIRENVDLVIFGFYRTNQKGKTKRTNKADQNQSGIVTREEIIRNCHVWNKLYKKTIVKDIRYPEGHVYEDIATTHKIIHRAERIYQCGEGLYYYRERSESITKSACNRTDAYGATIQRYRDLVEMGYMLEGDKTLIQLASVDYCGQASKTDERLYQIAVGIVEGINKIPRDFDIKHRLKFLLWKTNRNIYRSLCLVYYKQIKKV